MLTTFIFYQERAMEIKFKKLHPDAVIPTRAHPSDAGADLTAISATETPQYIQYGTGIALQLPEGYSALIFPRSSISKMDLSLCNSIGLIDQAYTGELLLRFRRTSTEEKTYAIGDRIGQLVILPIPTPTFTEITTLDTTDRGAGGFGSTDA
jgi:dUTP pyrophosphatase